MCYGNESWDLARDYVLGRSIFSSGLNKDLFRIEIRDSYHFIKRNWIKPMTFSGLLGNCKYVLQYIWKSYQDVFQEVVVPENQTKFLSSRRKIPPPLKYGQYHHHYQHSDNQVLLW